MSSSFCCWGLKNTSVWFTMSCFYLFCKWISLLQNGFIRFHHLLYGFHNFILIKLNTEIVSSFFFFSAFREPQTMFEYCLTARSKLNVIVPLFFIYACTQSNFPNKALNYFLDLWGRKAPIKCKKVYDSDKGFPRTTIVSFYSTCPR